MLGKLLQRLTITAQIKSQSLKQRNEEIVPVVIIKLKKEDKERFRKLFEENRDLFHYILFSGYLTLGDLFNAAAVCKAWNMMIEDPSGWSMFKVQLSRVIGTQKPVGVLSQAFPKENSSLNVKLLMSFCKMWAGYRRGILSGYFRFGNRRSDEESLASPFLSLKFCSNSPILEDCYETLPNLSCLPDIIDQKNNSWFRLIDPVWTEDKPFEDYVIDAIILACRFEFPHNYRCQPVVCFKGCNFKDDTPDMSNLLSITAEIIQIESNCIYTESSPIQKGGMKQEKNVSKFSNFHLSYLSKGFTDYYDYDSDETDIAICKRPASNRIINDQFNMRFEKLLFEIWSRDLLQVRLVRNYIFLLLIYMTEPLTDRHSIMFYDDLEECCSEKESLQDLSEVQSWVQQFLERQQKQDSETFYCFVEQKEARSGYVGAKTEYCYVYCLTLTRKDNSCSFEVTKYQFYYYCKKGFALS